MEEGSMVPQARSILNHLRLKCLLALKVFDVPLATFLDTKGHSSRDISWQVRCCWWWCGGQGGQGGQGGGGASLLGSLPVHNAWACVLMLSHMGAVGVVVMVMVESASMAVNLLRLGRDLTLARLDLYYLLLPPESAPSRSTSTGAAPSAH